MRMKWMLTALIAMGMAAPVGAAAQAKAASQPVSQQQFDIGVSGYETLTSSTSGLGTKETPTNAPGGFLEIRYLMKPLLGLELDYGFNKRDTTFAPDPATCGLVSCTEPVTKLNIKENNLALDYVASAKLGSLRPFAVAGVGFNITAAAGTTYPVREVIRAAYNVGGGIDWNFLSHFGFRAQVRDYLVKAPNNSSLYAATGKTAQTLEPMAGFYYRF